VTELQRNPKEASASFYEAVSLSWFGWLQEVKACCMDWLHAELVSCDGPGSAVRDRLAFVRQL